MNINGYLTDLKKQQEALAVQLTAKNVEADSSELLNELIPKVNDVYNKGIEDSQNQMNNTFANALKSTKFGTAILIDDVSPVTHDMSVKVRSKNILPYPYAETTKTLNGITITDNGDGSINLNGTSTAQVNFYFSQNLQLKKGITYTLSASGNYYFGGSSAFYIYNSTYNSLAYINLNADNSFTFTPTKDINGISCYIVIPSDRTVSGTLKPQLELGSTATAYTPYIPDLTAVKVSRCGKNLITFPYTYAGNTYGVGDTYTHNGVTFTVNADRSITANGTAGNDTTEALFNFFDASNTCLADSNNPITVTLSGCPSGGSSSTYVLVQRNHYYMDVGKGVTYKTNKNTQTYTIIIKSGTTVENLVFKPQLELGITKTEYEPYIAPTEYTPNADGTVEGVTSLYPNTTLTTDKDGVLIDCEYNRDINKFSGADVDVPTKTSELINDSNFATQDYVDEEIANFDFIKIVTVLPETGLVNRTYFVPKEDPNTNDLYDEYMWVDNKWELITTKQIEVDLTKYVKHTDINQSYNPLSTNAQSGKAVSEAISPIRQTITVDTPVWNIQPTITGTLNEAFEIWSIRPYFVTLKNTDGTDLESRQFKLCTTLNGYASAIEQIFTLTDSSITLTENFPVDFKSISSDRTSFEMRNAGVSSISINTKNLKSQRYIFSVFQSLILKNIGTKFIYLKDSVGKKLGTDSTYYSPIGRYGGNNGFLLAICSSNVTDTCILGYVIKANRTKKGFVDSLTGLRFFNAKQEAISQYAFSYVSNRIDDFQQEDLSYFTFVSNDQYYFGNGTVITLEEFE